MQVKCDNGQVVKCPSKEDLQHKCTAALEVYRSAIKDLGLPIDPLTGAIMPQSIKELRALEGPVDPKTGLIRQPYLAAMALHREYHKASLGIE